MPRISASLDIQELDICYFQNGKRHFISSLQGGRPPRKLRFVFIAGALSYGFTCFLGVLLLPFVLLGSQLAAQLDADGHSDWAIILDFVVKYSAYVLLNALLVFAVAVPIYLRKKWPAMVPR